MTTLTGDSKSFLDTITAKFYDLYVLEKDPVFVTEHDPVPLSMKEGEHFIKLRKMDHLNLNNFIGLSLDGIDYKAIWKYCSRSSLLVSEEETVRELVVVLKRLFYWIFSFQDLYNRESMIVTPFTLFFPFRTSSPLAI